MRLLATMVVRDEAGRYLEPVLDWLVTNVTPLVAVYDDGSSDNSVVIARDHGCAVAVRDETDPAFLDDESRMRQDAWRWLEVALDPQPGEWVLSIDADEFLLADSATVESDALRDVFARADAENADAIITPRVEVFGFDADGAPLVRTDGSWSKTVDRRLVRWMAGGTFHRQALAGGSLPEYVRGPMFDKRLSILHFGYATEQDRRTKHARYLGRPGHGRGHIDSILTMPTLTRWDGKAPTLGGASDVAI